MTMMAWVMLANVGACDGDSQSPVLADRILIGEVDDDIFVAVVTDAEQVLAYVCDGTPAAASIGLWFVGSHDGVGFSLTHESGARLDGQLADDSLAGNFTLGAQALEYAAAPAEGDAGLFLAQDEDELRGGWIVRADGSQRGAVLHRNTGDIVAAQPIMPSQSSVMLQALTLPLVRLIAPAFPG